MDVLFDATDRLARARRRARRLRRGSLAVAGLGLCLLAVANASGRAAPAWFGLAALCASLWGFFVLGRWKLARTILRRAVRDARRKARKVSPTLRSRT